MEQELSKFDPSRPANYNRCEWLIAFCYCGCVLSLSAVKGSPMLSVWLFYYILLLEQQLPQ